MTEIDNFLKEMKKEFGDNAVFTLKDIELQKVDVIPTGSLAVDVALGIGGIPRGRVTELYGQQGAGKTTLCYHVMAEAQKLGLKVLFVDSENAVDISYAKDLGVDVDSIYWNQPMTSLEALTAMEKAINTGEFGLVILDSIAMLAPKKEQDDDFENANVALNARDLSKFFRRQSYNIRDKNVALLMTNQLRANIGSYFGGTVTPGGNAKDYAASVLISIKRSAEIKDAKDVIGHTAEVNIKKNKLAPPFRTATFDIIYGEGIDPYRDMVEVAKNLGVLTQKGSYYVYKDENIGQGKDKAAEALRANKELYQEIRKECLNG